MGSHATRPQSIFGKSGIVLKSIEQKFDLLLGEFTHLEPRIRHLEYDTTLCSERINVRCSYVSFRDGEITFEEFLDAIADLIVPFCLPRSEIQRVQKQTHGANHVTAARLMTKLTEKAKSLFIKAKKGSHRSGEAGELVLYALNEWILKAPQIVSKMYLKTNSNMPVHGTDGVHARYDDLEKCLLIFWGESKCHKTLSSSLGDALNSIKEFVSNGQENREIDIVSDHIDLGELGSEAEEAILQYLDPYAPQSNNRLTVFSCLLMFRYPNGDMPDINADKIENWYVSEINTIVEDFIGNIKKKVKRKGLGTKRFEFFLVPVPSEVDFRDGFQKRIGWPND